MLLHKKTPGVVVDIVGIKIHPLTLAKVKNMRICGYVLENDMVICLQKVVLLFVSLIMIHVERYFLFLQVCIIMNGKLFSISQGGM